MIKVLTVSGTNSGVYYYRMKPHALLNYNEFEVHHTELLDSKDSLVPLLKEYDIVVFNRAVTSFLGTDNSDKIIGDIKEAGCKLVIDVDDYWQLPKYHDLHKSFEQTMRLRIIKAMRSADLVTTSTRYLAEKIAPYNKNVRVIKNAIYKDDFQWGDFHVKNDKLVVGYTGAMHHTKDLKHIEQEFEKLKDIDVELRCYTIASDDMPKIISAKGTNKNFDLYPPLTIDGYGIFYASIDIVIAPLYKDEFTKCKSELKAIEAGHYGCAFVGSNQNPYTNICNKYNSMLVEPDGFADAIRELNNDRDKLKELSGNLFADVNKNYDIEVEALKRAEAYKSIL